MMAAPPSTYGIINMVGGLHVWQWCWLNWQGNCLDYWNFWSRKSGSLMADWGGGGGGYHHILSKQGKVTVCCMYSMPFTVCYCQLFLSLIPGCVQFRFTSAGVCFKEGLRYPSMVSLRETLFQKLWKQDYCKIQIQIVN